MDGQLEDRVALAPFAQQEILGGVDMQVAGVTGQPLNAALMAKFDELLVLQKVGQSRNARQRAPRTARRVNQRRHHVWWPLEWFLQNVPRHIDYPE